MCALHLNMLLLLHTTKHLAGLQAEMLINLRRKQNNLVLHAQTELRDCYDLATGKSGVPGTSWISNIYLQL